MQYVIGIDEVGRGSLAGPVIVTALAVPKGLGFRNKALGMLKDSKQLTPAAREKWSNYTKKHPHVFYATARVQPHVIDRINISNAANLAAFRAFNKLSKRYKLNPNSCSVYLDGGLYLKSKKSQARTAKTIVRGDEKIPAISLASIVAKVSRDRLMVRLAKEYPKYGFEVHKGYGTKIHRTALRKYGPSGAHRLTFIDRIA